MTRKLIITIAITAAFAAPVAAQSRKATKIPPGFIPSAGLCRIWIDGVPPGRQPAPTDCRLAELNRPVNGRVIYGAESRGTMWRNGLTLTRERDSAGRVIFRDARGRVVTRERASDGTIIWRDAGGNVLRRDRVGNNRFDGRDDDRLSKAEKERLKAWRKAEKSRGDDRDDDKDRRKHDKRKKGKG